MPSLQGVGMIRNFNLPQSFAVGIDTSHHMTLEDSALLGCAASLGKWSLTLKGKFCFHQEGLQVHEYMLGPTYPVTQCNILEDQNPCSYQYENHKSKIQNLIWSVSTLTMNEVKEVRHTSFTSSWKQCWLPKCSTSLKITQWTNGQSLKKERCFSNFPLCV